MKKKTRDIYQFALYQAQIDEEEAYYEADGWEIDGPPAVAYQIPTIDDVDFTFTTASITAAQHFYHKNEINVQGDEYLTLTALQIEVTDEEWRNLQKKEKLDYEDYFIYLTNSESRTVAWRYKYRGIDSTLEELLKVHSENFNMRVICEKAGVSYSTYRGFKYNNQPFSHEKVYELLKTMNAVGNECWDEDFEEQYNTLKRIKERKKLLKNKLKK